MEWHIFFGVLSLLYLGWTDDIGLFQTTHTNDSLVPKEPL